MKKLWFRAAALAVALVAGSAAAVSVGGTLYVRWQEAALLDSPGGKVKGRLSPGTAVTWLGADANKKTFHKVKAGDQEGFMLQTSLTPRKPGEEQLARDDGKPISAQAFASSGAATKGLTEAGLKYDAEKAPGNPQNALQVVTQELIAKSVTAEAIEARNKKVGLGGGAK